MTGQTLGYETIFPAQLLGCYNEDTQYSSDPWMGATFNESRLLAQPTSVHAECCNDIESIYTEIHKSVDQVISEIPLYTPLYLDQVREQNYKLIAKLKHLENAITRGTTPTAVVNDSGAILYLSANSESTSLASSSCTSGEGGNYSTLETREIWQDMPDSCSPPMRDIATKSIVQKSPCPRAQRSSFASMKSSTKLAKKLLLVGNHEARIQVAEFAAQLQLPTCPMELPKISHIPRVSTTTGGPHFLQLVVNLGLAIESSIFGEQSSRILKRISMAHFYHAYTHAQENPKAFLSWCDDQGIQGFLMLPKGGSKSAVQHRFADLIFSRDTQLGADNADNAKRRAAKIQMWRKSGKKWAQFIQRFGYGILLLLPSCLTDEE